MMKHTVSLILLLIIACFSSNAQKAYLQTVGSTQQMIVDGKPFLILGGELGNSSASSPEDIDRIFPKLQRMGLNTVLVPAYWDLMEPRQGQFDFSLTDKVITTAEQYGMKVVFLWFGAWKNSMSCYAPEWFKRDYARYPRAQTAQGKPLEIASAFSENVFKADNTAFGRWLTHISEFDKNNTVIMIQIENEIGMLESARDYSPEANELFVQAVPTRLMNYLQDNKISLHPQMAEKWGKGGFKTTGTWTEIFGDDIYTEEIFMAYHYALYVERMAQSARLIYNVPLYVNAAMNSRGRKPGEYPSAGPLVHLIDIWRCGAPSIDFISPDIYDKGFTDWASQYKRPVNPLFIPEMRLTPNNGVQAFYAFGEHDALGVSPFSIENGDDSPEAVNVKAYACLREMMPLLTSHQGQNYSKGLLFDMDNKERIIEDGDFKITCRHFFTLPWDSRATDGSQWPEGGGIILRLAPNEYIVAGSGIVVTFEHKTEALEQMRLGEDGFAEKGEEGSSKSKARWRGQRRAGIVSCDEVKVNADGSTSFVRRLNGDEDHQGRHVRIGVDDFKVLRVKLYEYR
jgi:hypothetical protein